MTNVEPIWPEVKCLFFECFSCVHVVILAQGESYTGAEFVENVQEQQKHGASA